MTDPAMTPGTVRPMSTTVRRPVAGEVVAFVSFALVQAVLAGHHRGVSLSRPGVPGAVLADGLLLFVVAMMGVGLMPSSGTPPAASPRWSA
jgi:hypothetical protein